MLFPSRPAAALLMTARQPVYKEPRMLVKFANEGKPSAFQSPYEL